MNDACMYLQVCELLYVWCMYLSSSTFDPSACMFYVHMYDARTVHLWSWSLILMHACRYDVLEAEFTWSNFALECEISPNLSTDTRSNITYQFTIFGSDFSNEEWLEEYPIDRRKRNQQKGREILRSQKPARWKDRGRTIPSPDEGLEENCL